MPHAALTYPFSLESERLILRSPDEKNAAALNEAVNLSIESLRPWMHWATAPNTMAESIENCQKAMRRWKEDEDYQLHIFHKKTNKLVGSTGLHRFDWKVPRFEIGYWIQTSECKKGYATEVVLALSKFCFKTLGARRVELHISTRNKASLRIAHKAGFESEGVLRNHLRATDEKLHDMEIFSKIS